MFDDKREMPYPNHRTGGTCFAAGSETLAGRKQSKLPAQFHSNPGIPAQWGQWLCLTHRSQSGEKINK